LPRVSGIMSRCTDIRGLISTFVKMLLYILLLMLSILFVVYIVSLVPMQVDVGRMVVLAIATVGMLYMWYTFTMKVVFRKSMQG